MTAPERGPARRRPTLKDVAAEAGVSTATVSYVLSGRAGATGDASERATSAVRAAAERLAYVPNRAAQAVRTGRTRVVQLSLKMLSDPWSLAVAGAVGDAASGHDLTTMILADGDWFEAVRRQASDVAYIDCGGDAASDVHSRLSALAHRGQRLVVFSETLEPDGFDVVRSDATPGCRLAVAHLLQHHRRIGCLTTAAAVHASAKSRYAPYVELLGEAGVGIRPGDVSLFENAHASAFAAAVRLLSQPGRPTAIYATTDFAAMAAINAAHLLGLSVPDDVAVVGVGSTPDASLVTPTLTTVGPPDFYRRQADIIVARALAEPDEPAALHEFTWTLQPGASTTVSSAV